MYLHALEVESFGGVRRARLTFDETTLLIGENDRGKSSFLEALALALGSPGGGFASVFMRAAGRAADLYGRSRPTAVIRKALGRRSKPAVAFDLILAAAEEGGPGVPPPLRSLIETCVRLARDGAPPTATGKAGTRRRR